MAYIVFTIIGFAGGALAMFIALEAKRRHLHTIQSKQAAQAADLIVREQQINSDAQKTKEELGREREQLKQTTSQLDAAKQEFEHRVISYKELTDENGLLKRDLRNLAVNVRKLELDRQMQQQSQEAIDQRVGEIGSRYLKESVRWIGKSLNPTNYANCKQRLQDVIERCRGIGFKITKKEEAAYIADLKAEYEKAVRAAYEREEQARIQAQIREEQKLEREIKREQERIARERAVLEAALATAMAAAADQYSAEVESLKARLAENEAKQRAISQAQLTKAGFVYVISNIGSFGDGVFKVGMTRRLFPDERIHELGSASVPFPFDTHMMIKCDNAPALETALHHALVKQQVNKTNPRKEFFRTEIETIVKLVHEHHGEVEYRADAEALQYRQSLTISDEDLHYIEKVFDEVEADGEAIDRDGSQFSEAELDTMASAE